MAQKYLLNVGTSVKCICVCVYFDFVHASSAIESFHLNNYSEHNAAREVTTL